MSVSLCLHLCPSQPGSDLVSLPPLPQDVTSRQSFLELSSWLTDLRRHADAEVVVILCANKHDLVEEEDRLTALVASSEEEPNLSPPPPPAAAAGKTKREVSHAEGEEFAKREGLMFVECSAKSGLGVNEVSRVAHCLATAFFLLTASLPRVSYPLFTGLRPHRSVPSVPLSSLPFFPPDLPPLSLASSLPLSA